MSKSLLRQASPRGVGAFLVFQAAFYLAYQFGMLFDWATPVPFWVPSTVLLCGLLQFQRRWWWLLLLPTLAIRYFAAVPVERPFWFLFSAFGIDCATAVAAALLLRRFMSDPVRFASVRDFGAYCLITLLLVQVPSAFAGAVAREIFGISPHFWGSWQQWYFGSALANLIVTPFVFYWVLRPPNFRNVSGRQWLEALLLATALGITIPLAFEPSFSTLGFADWRFYAPVAFLVWAAVRFGMRGATAATMLLSYVAVTEALSGNGQFAGQSPADTAARVQEFLLLRAAPLYLVAVLIEQTRFGERSLRESERRFRSLADSAPVLVWMSGLDGLCDFFNKGWLDFTGRSAEQEYGNGWATGVHPDDLQRCLAVYRGSFAAREPFEMEYRLHRWDGDYRWTLDRGVPRYSASGEFLGYIGCSIDVTDRRNQEAALRQSEERYRGLVESQSDFVCRFLDDTTLTFVNEAYCKFLGRSRDELLGTTLLELLPGNVRGIAASRIEQAATQEQACAWECEAASPDGSQHWQHWACHAIRAPAGTQREFQAIGHDITDRKRADIANQNLAHTSRLATFGELTALIAHEINQPLCTILSNAEAAETLLRSKDPPLEEILQILADIRDADLRADETIRGIRALSRQRDMQLQPIDLNQTIGDVLRLAAGDALYRRVNIRRELCDPLPPVFGDRAYVEQVLLNLIVNGMDAMKDCPERARELGIRSSFDGNQEIQVTVTDRGHGIPAEKMSQLFDSFFTTKLEGVGLGLSIARSIIQAHGGRIWAENRAAGGAAFHFTLQTTAAASPSRPPQIGAG